MAPKICVQQIVDPSREWNIKSVPVRVIIMWKSVPQKKIHSSSDLSTVQSIKNLISASLLIHEGCQDRPPSTRSIKHNLWGAINFGLHIKYRR